MSKMQKKEFSKYIYYVSLIVSGIIFFFLIGQHGPIVTDDSKTYLNPSPGVSVIYLLYPGFLKIFSTIFGEQFFLYAVYITQGLLAIVASVMLTEFFRKEYNLNYVMAFVVFMLSVLPYGYSLPESVVTHHILTEGVTFPVFTLYMMVVIKLFLCEKKRYICEGLILSVVLVLLRPQLLVLMLVFLLLCVLFVLKKLYNKVSPEGKMRFVITHTIIGIIISVLAIWLFYKVLLTGQLSQFSDAITGRVLCLMEYEDRDLFEGETQEVFDELYQNASDRGNLLNLKDKQRANDIAETINENTKDWVGVISDYYNKKYSDLLQADKMYKYRMRNAIVWEMFEAHLVDYFVMTMKLLPYSFVASIFIQPDALYELCHVIAAGIYLFAIGFTVYAQKKGCSLRYLKPFMLTLFVIVLNVVVTNIFFYGQQRYVVYPFGMFYISVFIEVIGICRNLQKQKPKYM